MSGFDFSSPHLPHFQGDEADISPTIPTTNYRAVGICFCHYVLIILFIYLFLLFVCPGGEDFYLFIYFGKERPTRDFTDAS